MIRELIAVFFLLSDDYREELTTKPRNFMLIGNRGRALLLMKRRCVADGMKHMYSLYRQRKCQQLVSALSLTIPSLREDAIIPDMEPETRHEELQVEKFAQTMMIAQCSFSRVD